MNNRSISVVVACVLLWPGLAGAQSVYKWTDDQGVTHFGDRQPAGRASEQVSVKTGKSRANAERRSPQEQLEAIDNTREQEDRRENLSAVEEARRKQREANCATARSNLDVINSNARIRVEENGEQRYLDPEQIQEQREKFEEIAEENCGPAPAVNPAS